MHKSEEYTECHSSCIFFHKNVVCLNQSLPAGTACAWMQMDNAFKTCLLWRCSDLYFRSDSLLNFTITTASSYMCGLNMKLHEKNMKKLIKHISTLINQYDVTTKKTAKKTGVAEFFKYASMNTSGWLKRIKWQKIMSIRLFEKNL